MFGLSFPTMIALLVLGVVLFGKNLPDVARSLGKGILEIKRSLQGLQDEVASHIRDFDITSEPARPPQRVAATGPKFSDPTEPV